jgi:hypothetical protein
MGFGDTLSAIGGGIGGQALSRLQSALLGPSTSDAPKPADQLANPAGFPGIISAIDGTRWNKVFPYYLAIKEEGADGSVNIATGISGALFGNEKKFSFNLLPQSINISTPFAMSVTATNGGVLEESNGVVFRNISISGTTGVWKEKANAGPTGKTDILTSLFPSFTSSVIGAAAAVRTAYDSVAGGSKKDTPDPDLSATGYFQFWNMHNFLLAYADLKKRKGSGKYRLMLGMPKDNLEFFVTPSNFDLRKDASNPLLYRYSVSFKAWGINKHSVQSDEVGLGSIPKPSNVGAIKALVNSLRASRDAMNAARGVLNGVQSDWGDVLQIYNQGTLFIKEVAGLGSDIAEFSSVLVRNKNLIVANADAQLLSEFSRHQGDGSSGGPTHAANVLPLESASGVPSTSIGGESGKSAPSTFGRYAGAAGNAFQDPVFMSKGLDSLGTLPDSVNKQINDAKDKALKTTSKDVRDLAAKIQQANDNYASTTGVMHDTYVTTYGAPKGVATRTVTPDDIILMAHMMDSKNGFISSLATGQIFQEREVDPFAVASQSLDSNDPSDTLITPLSAYAVAVDRGATLDDIALKYLGDATRGRDVAILNSLRSPYVDEAGSYSPISGASGRTFVTLFESKYGIGQRIQVVGTGVGSTYRRVIGLQDLGGGAWRVTVDGQDNLDIFSPATNPSAWSRLLGSIGSGDTILIPSEDTPAAQQNRPTAAYAAMGQSEKIFGIDIGLDGVTGDLAIGADGDFAEVSGYDNGSQVIKILAETQLGEIKAHPGFGLSAGIGTPNYNATSLASELERQITADPRFLSANVEVTIEGSVLRAKISAQGAGGAGIIPLAFEVNTLPQ